MANPEHLAKLKEGVAAWNEWRKEYPRIKPDLSNKSICDYVDPNEGLSRMNLSGVNFQSANLRGLKIQGTDLTGAILQAADLRGAKLQSIGDGLGEFSTRGKETILEGANLIGADLTDADVYGVKYDHNMKCFGIRAAGCHGSQVFIRHVLDLAYIEEFKEKYPIKHFIWSYTSDCGRSWELWLVWCIGIIGIFAILFDWIEEKSPLLTSIKAFTSFGFVDTQISSQWGPLLCWIEIALGYVMFASLVSLVASQMARRSG